jgi:hypothetical protein
VTDQWPTPAVSAALYRWIGIVLALILVGLVVLLFLR